MSPDLHTSSTFSTRRHSISDMWTKPSRPGANSTKAPKVISRVTIPSNSCPTSGSIVIASTNTIASLHLSIFSPVILTMPSSSTLISHSVSSMIFLIFFPPGPINAPIFSGLICRDKILGAYLDISFGLEIASSILLRMCIRPSCACFIAFSINSNEIPSIFRSSWMAVIPVRVPATLKSISPK